MTYSHRFLTKFGKLSVFTQSCLIVVAAVIGAEALTLIFYGIFFADRLLLDLFLTAVIVVIVSFPLAYFFIGQQVKLALMAVELDRTARTDGLTELMNRKTFFEVAAGVIALDKPGGALLFIDVDHFKSINDTYGHAAGDAVLRQLASVIRASIRKKDLAARLGGEEFAILLVDADRAEALQVAERVRTNVRNVWHAVAAVDRPITVSIGVCVREPAQGLEDILLKADRNLYAAKSRGRDLVVDDGPLLAITRIGADSTQAQSCRAGAA